MEEIKESFADKTGLPPGSLVFTGEQKVELTRIRLIEYDAAELDIVDNIAPADLSGMLKKDKTQWFQIIGLHQLPVLEEVGKVFNIHPLELEDILNTNHPPKADVEENHIYIALKIYDLKSEDPHQFEQLSILFQENRVITFTESDSPIWDHILERIRKKARICKNGADYLMYALLDLVVDYYFKVSEQYEIKIEQLENNILISSDEELSHKIHELKQSLLIFRKNTRPLREMINAIIRDETELLAEKVKPYLYDLLDHCLHISENTELQREMVLGLREIYFTQISNRMNEIMKVLTIIATIFIPLTFLAGIYGMNFELMPELKWRWAYPAFWGVSILIFILLIVYFKRKKWF